MSLGIRLMISAMALLGCLAFGSVFVNWRTVGKVDTKIRAGLTVGAHAVGNVVAPGRAGGPCEPPLGDRPSATITASTSLSASEPPPRWSYWVLARTSVVGRVDIPSLSNAVLLETDPYNEIGEASGDIVLSDAVPRHVVRSGSIDGPLDDRACATASQDLSAAFSHIGDGDCASRDGRARSVGACANLPRLDAPSPW